MKRRRAWLDHLRAELLPINDRRRTVRWSSVLPLVALSILLGLAVALAVRSLDLIPAWIVVPLGNGLGFVLVWLWLPSVLPLRRRVPMIARLLIGLGSAAFFLVTSIMAAWDVPPWVR